MKRRIPLALTTYLIVFVAFMVLWFGLVFLRGRADVSWRRAGNTGLETEQQATATLLARAQDEPCTLEEIVEWSRYNYPNLKFALFNVDGDLVVGHGVEHLADVDFGSIVWGNHDVVVLDDGAEVSRHRSRSGRTRYAITRYVVSSEQWHVTYVSYGIGIAVVLLTWFVVATIFARIFAVPIRKMAGTAIELADGNLAARTDLVRPDEIGMLACVLDQMAERLDGMLRSQQVLMAQVSHELRTPLARLRVAVDLVEVTNGEEAREQILAMSDDLLELETLVSDVLALSRLDVAMARGEDGGALRRDSIQPSDWIPSVLDRFSRAHPERALEKHLAADLPAIEADRVLIGRVLMNLLDNADKYSSRDCPIRVEASADGDYLEVRVGDDGPGIPDEDLERVFEPFYRGRAATETTTGGYGLGLSFCRRAARLYDGEVTLENHKTGGVDAVLRFPTKASDSGFPRDHSTN